MFELSLFVKPGEELTPTLWNKLCRAGRATRILFGNGIRGRRTPDGVLLSCSLWSPWPHAFKCSLSGGMVAITKGLFDLMEPTIKSVPISGTDKLSVPKLDVSNPKLNAAGDGWICIEATVDKTTLKTKSAEVLQVDSLTSADPLKTRHALALLNKPSGGNLTLFQIEYFNVKLFAYPGNASAPAIRYFVVPA